MYYYVKIKGLSKECKMEDIFDFIPKNKINKIGFVCSCCGTYILDNTNKLCNTCVDFNSDTPYGHEFIIESPDKNLIINSINFKHVKDSRMIITKDFEMSECIEDILEVI